MKFAFGINFALSIPHQIMNLSPERKKHLKITGAALGTVLLGAIGSGVWQHIGAPVYKWIARAIINSIDAVFSNYKDSIYQAAAIGHHEYSANVMYVLFLGVLPILYLGLVLRHPARSPNNKKQNNFLTNFFRSRGGLYFLSVLTGLVFCVSAISATRIVYTNAITTYFDSSLDRLAPHLSDAEEERMLAKFRSVRTADDYYIIYEEIQSEFKNLGIEDYSSYPL